jgi:hypothetical protein
MYKVGRLRACSSLDVLPQLRVLQHWHMSFVPFVAVVELRTD